MHDIPVTGFLYRSDDGPEHSHHLYLTTWDRQPIHTHSFQGTTSFEVGHTHQYAGTTEPAPSGVPHTHSYFTFTTFNDGHKHTIRGMTTVDGMVPHQHHYSGETSR